MRSPLVLYRSARLCLALSCWRGTFVCFSVFRAIVVRPLSGTASPELPLFARLVCLSRHCLRGPLTWFSPLFVRSFSRLPLLERPVSSARRCWRNRSLPHLFSTAFVRFAVARHGPFARLVAAQHGLFRLAAVWQGPFVRIDVAYASRSSESPLFSRPAHLILRLSSTRSSALYPAWPWPELQQKSARAGLWRRLPLNCEG